MLLIFVSIILVESVMFGIFIPKQREKNRLFILGALIAIFLAIAKVANSNALIGIVFVVGHIALFAMYLIYYFHLIIQSKNKDLKTLLGKYVKIPTCFYLITIIAVLYALIVETKANDIASVMLIFVLVIAAGIYNFAENRTLNNLSKESFEKMELHNLKQYIYRKNALVAIYSIFFSIAAGTLYISIFDSPNGNITVLIFVLELAVNMIIYIGCYHKVKVRFMLEEGSKYPKWQLVVPKKVGVGYTFNFGCPLTYILLAIVFLVVIISLL